MTGTSRPKGAAPDESTSGDAQSDVTPARRPSDEREPTREPWVEAQSLRPQRRASETGLAVPASALHVLYLDDEEAVAVAASRLLRKLGYSTTWFVRGRDAVEALRQEPTRFHGAIVDYQMPEMSGLEVAREIRQFRVDLPIVLTSGRDVDRTDDELAELGIRHRLEKPFGLAELEEALRRARVAAS